MTTKNHIILDNIQISQKIKRIAYQIYEANIEEDSIVIAGIVGNGFRLAETLSDVLKNISPINILLCEVVIDKKNPLQKINTSLSSNEYQNTSLVLVDDVLNSGTTLIYGIKHFLEVPLKRFKTAVLVNRNHKKYPVKADFKGISLSTSINEHIQVEFSEKECIAYLE